MISGVEQFVLAAWLVPSVAKRLSDRNGSTNAPANAGLFVKSKSATKKKSQFESNWRRRENGRREDKRK
jgi:hypothetical protein